MLRDSTTHATKISASKTSEGNELWNDATDKFAIASNMSSDSMKGSMNCLTIKTIGIEESRRTLH